MHLDVLWTVRWLRKDPFFTGSRGSSDGTGGTERSSGLENHRHTVERHARPEVQVDSDLRAGRSWFGDADRLRRRGQPAVDPRRTAAEGDCHSRLAGRRVMASRASVAIREPRARCTGEFGWDGGGTIAVTASDKAVGRVEIGRAHV